MNTSMHGAILLQRSKDDNAIHPVYYCSGKTTAYPEERYTSYELEILAIVKVLNKIPSLFVKHIIQNCY